MVRRKPRRKPLGTIWETSGCCGCGSSRSSGILARRNRLGGRSPIRRKMPNAIIFRLSPPSGTNCPSGTDPRARSTTGPAPGLQQGSSSESGRSWSPSVTNSAGCSGSGSRPTRCWARPASGGEKTGKNPTPPRKKGTKKRPGDRWRAGGPLVGDRRGERAGTEAPGSDDRVSWSSGPNRQRMSRNTCPWIRRTTTQRGKGAATAAGYTPHIRRIGEEKKGCDRSQGHAAAMGGRADVRMAVEVPRDLVRYDKKDINYLWADSAGLRTVLVSQAPPHGSM